ncbi:glycosyltransferase family 2 protein [Lachnospiraceae bacterium 62-26]
MVKLSIVVAAYNHEKYIEKTIQSIRDQIVDFEYEVIIGEDCSTDKTRNILKRIQKNCPDNFRFYYREKNLGAEKNFRDLYSKMRGEYFIVLEGDDYWIYPYKLQRQVDFLEKNREYIAYGHDVIVVDKDSIKTEYQYPSCKKTEYSLKDFSVSILPGQTATILSRNYFLDKKIDKSILNVDYYAGDRRRAFLLAANGKVYCSQHKWSAYRYIFHEGNSYSANISESEKTHAMDIELSKAMIKYAKNNNNSMAQRVAEAKYISSLYSMKKFMNSIEYYSIIKKFFECKYKKYIIYHFIRIRFLKSKEKEVK